MTHLSSTWSNSHQSRYVEYFFASERPNHATIIKFFCSLAFSVWNGIFEWVGSCKCIITYRKNLFVVFYSLGCYFEERSCGALDALIWCATMCCVSRGFCWLCCDNIIIAHIMVLSWELARSLWGILHFSNWFNISFECLKNQLLVNCNVGVPLDSQQ